MNAGLTLDMWTNIITKCAIPETHEKNSICHCFMTPFWSCSGNLLNGVTGTIGELANGKSRPLSHIYLSYVPVYQPRYSKQLIFGLTQEWFRELSFSRLECGVHNKLHISSADWWDLLLPLTSHRHQIEGTNGF